MSPHQNLRFTYEQLDQQAHCLASALLRAGLAPGDRAGIWAHNCAQWLLIHESLGSVSLWGQVLFCSIAAHCNAGPIA